MHANKFGAKLVAVMVLAFSSDAQIWAATYTAPPNQVNLRIPPVGTGGSGIPTQDVTTSTIRISGLDTNQGIPYLKVNLSLNHTYDGDLVITLKAPDGTAVQLANRVGGSGDNFANTTFDSEVRRSITNGVPPFSGSFRPVQSLLSFFNSSPDGNWTLQIDDRAAGDVGTLLSWSLTFLNGGATQCSADPLWKVSNFASAPSPSTVSDSADYAGTHSSFVANGDMLYAFRNSDGQLRWSSQAPIGNWHTPVVARLFSGQEFLFLSPDDGFIYKINAEDKLNGLSKDLRRGLCATDRLVATPVIQLSQQSDATFRNTYDGQDLVYAVTYNQACAPEKQRIVAFRATDVATVWTFNLTAAFQLGSGTSLLLDYASNTLYCATAGGVTDEGASFPPRLWAISSITNISRSPSLKWSAIYGEIAMEPVLANRALYLVSDSTLLRKLDADTGAEIWNYQLPGLLIGKIAVDPIRNLIFVTMNTTNRSVLRAMRDLGETNEVAWTSSSSLGDLTDYVTTSPVVAPGLGWVYAGSAYGAVHEFIESQSSLLPVQSYASARVGPAAQGPVTLIVTDSETGGATINRLTAIGGGQLRRFCIPWGSGDHGNDNPNPILTPATDLAISAAPSPASVIVGQPVTYSLSVTNRGTNDTTGVSVGTVLPADSQFVSATVSQGSYFFEENAFTAHLGGVTNGGSAALSFTVIPTRGGPRGYTATVSSDISDLLLGNNTMVGGSYANPELSISNASVLEGNSGTTPMMFPVTLSGSSDDPVSVSYGTFGLTADADVDYVSTYGTLSFAPGETNKTVTVPVIGDTIIEGNEFFLVLLSNPTNAVLSTNQNSAVGTIVDDDGPVVLHIAQAGDKVLLSWSTNIVGFTLQTTYDLNGFWDQVFSPVGVVGNQNVVTNNVSFSEQFYRLRK